MRAEIEMYNNSPAKVEAERILNNKGLKPGNGHTAYFWERKTRTGKSVWAATYTPK